jgi:hypothetical protein
MKRLLAVAVILAVGMVGVVPMPAHAGASVGPLAIDWFAQVQRWLQQFNEFVWKIQGKAGELYQRLIGQISQWVQQTGVPGMVQQVQQVLGELGRLTGSFGWAYQSALADLQRLIGMGTDPRQVGSRAWFAATNPRTQAVVERAAESAVVTAAAVERAAQSAETSATVARQVNLQQDITLSAQQTYGIAGALRHGAINLPSTRAGIQVLIAGQAAELQAQADAMQALGTRINALATQEAASAQQLDALTQAIRQIADNQAAQAKREEEDRQAALGVIEGGVGTMIRSSFLFLGGGIATQRQDTTGLFTFRRR